MAHDENFTRFFCFLSLFAAAMLGVVIANSLLLLFMCWELVGLDVVSADRILVSQTQAAAAAKKAFITTRIGDVVFLLGMVWLYAQTGTLLFYDSGAGCLEKLALGGLLVHHAMFGLSAATAIGLLIFAARWASPARCRCTSGCRTRWKARRRSARSSTRRRWWRRACFWSRACIR